MGGVKPMKQAAAKRVKDSLGDRIFRFVVAVLVVMLALTCILPLINILAISFSSARAVNSNEVVFLPIEFNTDAYASMFRSGSVVRAMKNSIVATVLYVALTMVCTVLCAYPLSHGDLVGRRPIWLFILFTMYFSGGMIPSYLLINEMGLLNSVWALVLPGAISTYNMILMRTFFAALPLSLKEAAYIDGANDLDILWRVVLPLSKAMLATIALFYAVSRWNAVQDGMLYISDPKKNILQVTLKNILISSESLNEIMNEGASAGMVVQTQQMRSATLIFSLTPVIVIYPFLQKYFVKGVMIGAVKG